MRTSSAKSKGRRACAEARELILKAFPYLYPEDIAVTPSGVTGEDLYLSPVARSVLPLSIECKNQEALNVWKALEQAQYHASKRPDTKPALIFKRNRSKLYITLELTDFLELYTQGIQKRIIDQRQYKEEAINE